MSRICYCCMKSTKDGDFCNHCGKKQGVVPSHHLVPGSILNGKYTIGNSIGEGGFGITYIGLDNSLQIKVAVKEFYPKGIVSRDSKVSSDIFCINGEKSEALFVSEKSKVINEARILAKFSKEQGIVNVRDYFEANNTAYIVMEYLEGETLEEYMKNSGPVSPEETYNLLYPVMRVVELLHKENIVHRDISPDNLMFDGKQLKLLDFGAAREVLYSTSKSFSVILKHGYAPEEQYRRKGNQGPWTDIYALCATMYFCMTGEVPDTSLDRLHDDELKPLAEYNVKLNKNQEYAMNKGLSVMLEDRFKSISEFIEAWNSNDTVPVVVVSKNNSNETVFGGDADYEPVNSSKRNAQRMYVPVGENPSPTPKKKGKGLLIFIIVLICLIILGGIGIYAWMKLSDDKNDDDSDNKKTNSVTTTTNAVTTKEPDVAVTIAPTTTDIITSEIDNFKSYLDDADVLAEEEKYDEAIATLETAKQLYGEDERVDLKLYEIKKEKGVFELEVLIADEKYLDAILYIDNEMINYGKDEDIVKRRVELVIKFRENVIEEADKALKEEGYEKAIEIIKEALDLIGEDEKFEERIEEYKEYMPVHISEIKAVSGKDYYFSSTEKDPRDNIYTDVLVLYSHSKNWSAFVGKIELFTDKKYSTFTCSIVPEAEFTTESDCGSIIKIYADEKLIFTSDMVTYKTKGIDVELDINNCEYLLIEVENISDSFHLAKADTLICDAYVSK